MHISKKIMATAILLTLSMMGCASSTKPSHTISEHDLQTVSATIQVPDTASTEGASAPSSITVSPTPGDISGSTGPIPVLTSNTGLAEYDAALRKLQEERWQVVKRVDLDVMARDHDLAGLYQVYCMASILQDKGHFMYATWPTNVKTYQAKCALLLGRELTVRMRTNDLAVDDCSYVAKEPQGSFTQQLDVSSTRTIGHELDFLRHQHPELNHDKGIASTQEIRDVIVASVRQDAKAPLKRWRAGKHVHNDYAVLVWVPNGWDHDAELLWGMMVGEGLTSNQIGLTRPEMNFLTKAARDNKFGRFQEETPSFGIYFHYKQL